MQEHKNLATLIYSGVSVKKSLPPSNAVERSTLVTYVVVPAYSIL